MSYIRNSLSLRKIVYKKSLVVIELSILMVQKSMFRCTSLYKRYGHFLKNSSLIQTPNKFSFSSFYHFPKVVRAVMANPTRTIFDLFIYGFSIPFLIEMFGGVRCFCSLKVFSLDSDRLDFDKFKLFFVI